MGKDFIHLILPGCCCNCCHCQPQSCQCRHKRRQWPPRCRCGQTVDLSPYYKRVEKGLESGEAWDQSIKEIEARTVHGLWKKDILAGKSGSSRSCPLPDVL